MLATSAVDREFGGLVGFKPRTIKLELAVFRYVRSFKENKQDW